MVEIALPFSLRTLAGEQAYLTAKNNGSLIPLHEEPSLLDWKYWRVIDNRFPYSTVFRKHHMLIPKRQVANINELSLEEFSELLKILANNINNEYDLWFVNTTKRRSIAAHFHIHVASYVLDREDIKL